MITVLFTTAADPVRRGLTYKIEFQNPETFREWWDDAELDMQRRKSFMASGKMPGANTAITVFPDDEDVAARVDGLQTWPFRLAQSEMTRLLALAETIGREYEEKGPGRPEARVLVCTTSKERRKGSLLVKGRF